MICEWFALCDRAASGTLSHPILGDVPICDRCRKRTEDLQADVVPSEPVRGGYASPAS